ncbi:parathymosin-like, partial [Clarias magur]
MACALKAELKCKDGSRREFTVQAERELKSLTEAVKTISSDLSVALTALVDEERSARADRGDIRAH